MDEVKQRSTFFWLTVIVLFGLLIRLDFLFASNFIIDSDEAIVGLMGKHFSEGATLPPFYYGQHYMGSFEPFLVGLSFSLFGMQLCLLKLVPLLFSLIFIVLLYFLGKELAGKQAGLYSALLGAISPAVLIVWSGKARGGFIEIVVIAALSILLSLIWLRTKGVQWGRFALLSVLLGFGWWVNNQIVFVYPVISLIVVAKAFRERKIFGKQMSLLLALVGFGTVCFFIGGLPFWTYNLTHEFATFDQLFRDGNTDIQGNLFGLINNAIPILLGGKRYWQTLPAFPGAVQIAYVLFSSMVVVVCLGAVRNRVNMAPAVVFLGIALTTVTVFVCSSFGYLSEAPRYLLPLYCVFLPLIGGGIATTEKVSPLVGRTFLVAFLLLHLSSAYLFGRAIPGEPFVFRGERVSKDQSELIARLRELGISYVRTNYWIGYRLAYETEEEITFSVFQQPTQVRIPEYERQLVKIGEKGKATPFVVVPTQGRILTRALKHVGYTFEKERASGYVIVHSLEAPSEELIPISVLEKGTISSSPTSSLNLEAAFDGDIETRWGSGAPQNKEMFITVEFEEPVPVSAFRYQLGEFSHDSPRDLEVQFVGVDGVIQTEFSKQQYRTMTQAGLAEKPIYLDQSYMVSKVFLRQLGEHPVFDWSVAELTFFTDKKYH